MCCDNPIDLGCFDSCQSITIEGLDEIYSANEVYFAYTFNGADRKQLIEEVSGDGEPIIDLSTLNEKYIYNIGLYTVSGDTLIGCYKFKVNPCAGDIFETTPVTQYVDSIITMANAQCTGETELLINITIPDTQLAAIKVGTVINLYFSSNQSIVGYVLDSLDARYSILSPTKVKILDTSVLGSGSLDVHMRIPGCNDMVLNCVVTEIQNLTPGWGNGIHTPGTININL